MVILGIAAALVAVTVLFSWVGARIGAQMEAKRLGAGIIEEQMKGGFTASGMGALIGVIPTIVFVTILVVMVLTAPPRAEDHAAPPGAPAASGH